MQWLTCNQAARLHRKAGILLLGARYIISLSHCIFCSAFLLIYLERTILTFSTDASFWLIGVDVSIMVNTLKNLEDFL
jgi:hypothetical protein